MPHDRDGERLGVGDTVLVPARILRIHDTEDYCNVDLETVQPMSPLDSRTPLTLNAKQVVLFHPRDASGSYRSKFEQPQQGTWAWALEQMKAGRKVWYPPIWQNEAEERYVRLRAKQIMNPDADKCFINEWGALWFPTLSEIERTDWYTVEAE
jgi:hypothetical protein